MRRGGRGDRLEDVPGPGRRCLIRFRGALLAWVTGGGCDGGCLLWVHARIMHPDLDAAVGGQRRPGGVLGCGPLERPASASARRCGSGEVGPRGRWLDPELCDGLDGSAGGAVEVAAGGDLGGGVA